jgi:hypothetical protein
MAVRGSFGLLKARYEITDDGRVTITRDVWLPVVLLSLAAPGTWCLVQALGSTHFDSTMFGIGFVGAMTGLFALVMTPWLMPGTIVFTREGVVWGATKVPRPQIAAVRANSAEIRSTQYAKYQSWMIVVALRNGKPLTLSLGNRNRYASTEPLVQLERAIVAALG